MFQLRQIDYTDISQYDTDYYRRSKDKEPSENCLYYGVFRDRQLISYFAVSDLCPGTLFIRRGYVLPQFRESKEYGRSVWKLSMNLLEEAATKVGYKYIEFYTERNPKAYDRMFSQLNFKMAYVGFRKNLGV